MFMVWFVSSLKQVQLHGHLGMMGLLQTKKGPKLRLSKSQMQVKLALPCRYLFFFFFWELQHNTWFYE